jgi:histidinol phosphatase-like PHP family hydrolase
LLNQLEDSQDLDLAKDTPKKIIKGTIQIEIIRHTDNNQITRVTDSKEEIAKGIWTEIGIDKRRGKGIETDIGIRIGIEIDIGKGRETGREIGRETGRERVEMKGDE